jgi:hypothetical protein
LKERDIGMEGERKKYVDRMKEMKYKGKQKLRKKI